MLLANVGLLIDGGEVPTPTRYTQPISVPAPLVIQPLAKNDPRNNATWIALNDPQLNGLGGPKDNSNYDSPILQGSQTSSLTDVIDPAAVTTPNTGSAATNIGLDSGTSGGNTESPLLIAAAPFYNDLLPAPNAGFVLTNSDQTSSYSDITAVPQPPAALPAPTYALDTPVNLYVDPYTFTKIISTDALGNTVTTYSVNLSFDPVDGANKYSYRVNATI